MLRLVAVRRVFGELLSAVYVLLPVRLPGSGGYLGHEVFMAISGRSCRNERRINLYGANDTVCSGTGSFINDRKSEARRWTCRKHCVSLV